MTGKKCVFVIGPEGSGSKLVARIIAHALDISPFGEWQGNGWCRSDAHIICHRSLPYLLPPRYPDIGKWILEYSPEYDLYFVLTTRDITLSELSRVSRFGKSPDQVVHESSMARQIMAGLLSSSDCRCFIWSYETFMFLGHDYLQLLYHYLGANSDFCPELDDGNRKRLLGSPRRE